MNIVDQLRQLLARKRDTFRLEGEGIPLPIPDPSVETIRVELERLRSSGPSHLALITEGGSYLQAAGNAKRMTVEGHFVADEHTTHVVLGRQGVPGPTRTIESTAGSIQVTAPEVWTAAEAAQLLGTVVTRGSLPANVSRRDISEEIQST